MARNVSAPSHETVSESIDQTFEDVRRVVQVGLSRLQSQSERLTTILLTLDNGHSPEAPESPVSRPKRRISAKQRADTSRRMKKYWAARRRTEKAKEAAKG